MIDINLNIPIDTTPTDGSTNLIDSNAVFDGLALKVDKVTGKQLSTEDYTTTEKSKLAGIAAGAEVNVNADFNAVSGDAQILNKPTFATYISDTITDGEITKAPTQNAVFDALALKENNLPSMVGNSLKVLRVNAGETAKEWATISTGLTIGTTPITSGTVGRILFEGAGNVMQEDSAFFWDNTNKRLGIGAAPDTNVLLDARSQGALSTDIAFRVRNSANTYNLFQINGDGSVFGNGGGGLIQNTAFGSEALKANTSGINNVAFGLDALRLNTSGGQNVAIGRDALRTGNRSNCTAIGHGALQNTIGDNNTGIGFNAGNTISTGIENVSIGYTSMGQAPAKTGQRNVCIGAFAATALTSGSSNILIGRNTGSNITTGSFNTLIGESLSTSAVSTNNNVILADGQANIAIWKNSSHFVGIGYNAPTTDVLGAKLDIKAQGALSTDIAFRVRNSADSANLFTINGLGDIDFTNGTYSAGMRVFFNGIEFKYGGGAFGSKFTMNNSGIELNFGGNISIGTPTNFGGGNSQIIVKSGTAPTSSGADQFHQYSADITAGNAAPHFRTENGSVIKLYKQDLPTNPTNAELATFLSNLGLANLI